MLHLRTRGARMPPDWPDWANYICLICLGYIGVCGVVSWLIYAYTDLLEQEDQDHGEAD